MTSKLTKRLSLLLLVLSSSSLYAVTEQQIQDEIIGTSPTPTTLITRDDNAYILGVQAIAATGVLLIPESTNDRVMAFDPLTGNLLNADFIPSDPTNLSTPIHAILAADNATVLVSDQLDDAVQRYDFDGNYLGIFAPLGGVDNNVLDNARGISLDSNGNLLVSIGGGTNANAIARFDSTGMYTGNFIANGLGGLDSPFDVLNINNGGVIVSGITSDAIHQYDNSGSFIGNLSAIDTFPEQIFETSAGNILVANFSGAEEGIVEYDATGTLIGIYDPPVLGGYRGVYELPNGNILTTNGAGVHEIDRLGNLVETKISGVSARFIEFVRPQVIPAIPVPSLSLTGLLIMIFGLTGILLFVKPLLLNRKED
jgi:hypothetical protein